MSFITSRARRDVLSKIGQNLEDAFVWIHTHLIGAMPPVYYQSFTLRTYRGVFKDLANEMSALARSDLSAAARV